MRGHGAHVHVAAESANGLEWTDPDGAAQLTINTLFIIA